MSYISVGVYTDPSFGDSSNNGVTNQALEGDVILLVPVENGHISDEDIIDGRYATLPVVILVPHTRNFRTGPYTVFYPPGLVNKAMFGGNFVYTSDSRFSGQYGHAPVAVHDRVE